MKTENTEVSEDLPVSISDADTWNSILPLLKAFPNVYVVLTPIPVESFSQRSSGQQNREQRGVGCRKPTGIGTRSIDASGDGVMRVFLKNFMNISMPQVNSLRCLLDSLRCLLDSLRCLLDSLRCLLDSLRCLLDSLRCLLARRSCVRIPVQRVPRKKMKFRFPRRLSVGVGVALRRNFMRR